MGGNNDADPQARVAAFRERHEMDAPLPYAILDLQSEVGELAKEVTTSTEYGDEPANAVVAEDELGDAFFSLLSVAEAADIDADQALDAALDKYEDRIETTGDAGSGE